MADHDALLFGVATAGFQIEGGFNGPGQPANNWLAWESAGRAEPSGAAINFWAEPEVALDRAAALGCRSFRFGIEWARVQPAESTFDQAVLDRYVAIAQACLDRGMEPLVTLHHFTHPAWLGADFWLRPDAPEIFRAWVERATEALAPVVRLWVTINEINVVVLGSWLLGMFPPGRVLAFGDVATATDHLLTAHVFAYEVIHRVRPDAVVTTNNSCLSLYEYDRLLLDTLLWRSMGVESLDLDPWLEERRRQHYSLLPGHGLPELALRRAAALRSPLPRGSRRNPRHLRSRVAVESSSHERTLDAIGIDYYDPMVGHHPRWPMHRTSGGRNPRPTRELWDDPPDPDGLTRWLGVQHHLTPDLPLWVVENGLCNRVKAGVAWPRPDGWNRPDYLRANIKAVQNARDLGVPVTGYWHWSLVDNYEWGSYEPRFGLYGVDRSDPEHPRWQETDAMGDDAATVYREIIAGLAQGDRSVLEPPTPS